MELSAGVGLKRREVRDKEVVRSGLDVLAV